jgi:hypothetical protein
MRGKSRDGNRFALILSFWRYDGQRATFSETYGRRTRDGAAPHNRAGRTGRVAAPHVPTFIETLYPTPQHRKLNCSDFDMTGLCDLPFQPGTSMPH